MKKKKGKKGLKILLWILGVLVALFFLTGFVNYCCNLSLRSYIDSFEEVKYDADRLVPVKEGDYYTITTDDELKVLHLTDIHIGGGFWTYKTDKKTIYELITILQMEKPDLVIMGGDNTYCLPFIGWNGGSTFNNRMAAKTLIRVYEHEKVYFSTVFGNHDTEAFDYYNRESMGKLYMDEKYEYSIFESQFSDVDAKVVPSVSNQFIIIKNSDGTIRKLLLLIDSNAYVDKGLMSIIKGTYDVIHDAEVDWARDTVAKLSKEAGLKDGEYLKTLVFMHIPVGEFQDAYEDLITEQSVSEDEIKYNVNESPSDTEFVFGCWDEDKIYYGGVTSPEIQPKDNDRFFEVLAEEMNSCEAIFCGHDHVNNAVVMYKGVMLSYGYSLDNTAYGKGMKYSGLQRGATVITVKKDGSFTEQHKNAYLDYGCSNDKFYDVYLDKQFHPEYYRTVR